MGTIGEAKEPNIGQRNEDEDNMPKKMQGTVVVEGSAYQKGYKIGFDATKALVDLSRATKIPLDRAKLREQADDFQRTCAALQRVVEGSQDERDLIRGYYDGMKTALGE